MAPPELLKWRCHKIVEAMRIAEVRSVAPGSLDHELVGELGSVIVVGAAYVGKHEPQRGGYYVRYDDGYESWSPAAAFEAGYAVEVESKYQLGELQVARAFTYHTPKPDQVPRYNALRGGALALARRVLELTPPGREQALALTKLEEAVMWANAAIARNE